MIERRQTQRIAKVLDATWHAQSGAATCRVTDISVNGCFVDARNVPGVNERATLTLTLGGTALSLGGNVRYVEPRMGFGLEFDPSLLTDAERDAMRAALA